MTMAEKEGDHRRGLESKSVEAAISIQQRGQVFSFLAFAMVLGLGGLLLWLGISLVAYIVLVGDLGVMMGGVIWNKVEDTQIRKLEERRLLLLESQQQKANQQRGKGKSKGKRSP